MPAAPAARADGSGAAAEGGFSAVLFEPGMRAPARRLAAKNFVKVWGEFRLFE